MSVSESVSPTVTVVVCAYKTGPKILTTIEAILAQTFQNFRVLVIDDASGDETPEIVRAIDDARVQLIQNSENLGVIGSRNKGLTLADTPFIATCDHDDIWLPTKLERQLDYMEAHPNCGVVGTFWTIYGAGRKLETRGTENTSSEFLGWCLFSQNCLLHSSLLMRAATLNENDICYRAHIPFGDDWKLCHEFARAGEVGIVPQGLVDYHLHGENFSITANARMLDSGATVLAEELQLLLDDAVLEQTQTDYFDYIARGETQVDDGRHIAVGSLIKAIADKKIAACHDTTVHEVIRRAAGMLWWNMCTLRAKKIGPTHLKIIARSELFEWVGLSSSERMFEKAKTWCVYFLRKWRLIG